MDRRLLSRNGTEIELSLETPEKKLQQAIYSAHSSNQAPAGGRTRNFVENIESSWPAGNQYALEEMEAATNGFDCRNAISCGDHAIVYHGVLLKNIRVAVKRLLSNRLL